jgi:RNA polymerase sigma-70 factor (ECF subfamily)
VTSPIDAAPLIRHIQRAEARDEVEAMPDLAELLAEQLADGRATWPDVPLDGAVYLRRLAAAVDARATESAERVMRTVPASDLYLAAACGAGDERAIAAFRRALLPQLAGALARLGAGATIIDETQQRVLEMLFVPRPGGPPQIATYSGRGRLHSWVCSIGVRTGRRMMGHEAGGDDDGLDRLAGPVEDPELELLRRRYADSFKAALVAALGDVTERQRNVLRQYHIDELTIDQIGSLYRINRATAARWVIAARAAVLAATRARLATDLRLAVDEVDSIIRLVRSRIDVTFRELLC